MNYKLIISYLGKNYYGFQIQKNKPTVQGFIELALFEAIGEKVKLTASGRTDAGVNALAQVANFETEKNLNTKKVMTHVNSLLPEDIRIFALDHVKDSFNARFSAKQKTYIYRFYISKIAVPAFDAYATRFFYDIDINVFKENLKQIVGKHDFTSVTAADCEYENKVREITYAEVREELGVYTVEITGNGFLKNMVRAVVGTLIDIARGQIKLSMREVLEKKDRQCAGKTAAPYSLTLKEVVYGEE